jgi:hypothetical protein
MTLNSGIKKHMFRAIDDEQACNTYNNISWATYICPNL